MNRCKLYDFRKSSLFTFSAYIILTFKIYAQKKVDTSNIVIHSLGSSVNSIYDDYAPVISEDGLILYFTSKRPYSPSELKSGKPSKEHVFVCLKDSADFIVVFLGCMYAGIVPVVINTNFSKLEVDNIIKKSPANTVICSEDKIDYLNECILSRDC
jgi:hypothetical protein